MTRKSPTLASGSARRATKPPSSCVKMSPDSHSGPPTTTSRSCRGRGTTRLAVGGADRHGVIGAVEDRAGQVVEAGVEQIERVLAGRFDRADFADQVAALGDQVAARLDFERNLVAELAWPAAGAWRPRARSTRATSTNVSPSRYGTGRPPPALIERIDEPTASAAFSIAPQTWLRCSRSVPEPMCMCRPVIERLVLRRPARCSRRAARARCRASIARRPCSSSGCARGRSRD